MTSASGPLNGIPHTLRDLERLKIDRLLVLIGAVIAILLAPLMFIWSLISGTVALFDNPVKGMGVLGGGLFNSMVSFIFGCLLFLIYTRMNGLSRNTYIIGLIFSIIVMIFGGTGGGLGGLVALIGIIIYLLKVEGVLDKGWPRN